jgi:protein-S-isoprenylcysteine O-methyltransferase Ste14
MQPLNVLRSFFFAALFIALQVWFLPRWAGIQGSWPAAEQEPWRWLGVIPAVLGAMLMLACVWRFGTTGEGTPAPFDAPRKFVAVGPYRYVRNPMYWGMALALVGEAILFADWSQWKLITIYAAVLVAITNAFVVFYEEPALRVKFGGEYEEYCRRVNRWWPRAAISSRGGAASASAR